MVPYFTFVLLVAVPTMLLEFSMGQFMSLGGIKVWNIVPIAKGQFIQNSLRMFSFEKGRVQVGQVFESSETFSRHFLQL